MIKRTAQYGTLAMKLAFDRMSHWARTPFLNSAERLAALGEVEETMGRTMAEGLGQLRGPAAKLGQMMALESGLLPERFRDQLQILQHSVSPMSYAAVRKVIKHSFQKSPEEMFKEFVPNAFAAASLGQVHRAVLKTGERVAVKIQYPGVEESVTGDFTLAQALFAPLANSGLLARTLSELKSRITDEMDYTREKENQKWFLAQNSSGLKIPKIYDEFCSQKVLTTELLEGLPLITQLANLSTVERSAAGQMIFDFFIRALFEWGALHGDPHGGNYIWLAEQKQLGIVDFGAAKKDFTPEVLEVFRGFFAPAAPEKMLALYEKLGADLNGLSPADRQYFYNEIIEPYRSRIANFIVRGTYQFNPEDTLARDLRVQLFSHAFHPRLQKFSGEFTLLHRTLYGVLNLLSRLHCQVSVSFPRRA
jgi:predicted unusual protein kinase regulating ubiquinone biosynthesis (AarF/ABC1/UbiB family)